MRYPLAFALFAITGCRTVTEDFNRTFSADGVWTVFSDVQRGNVSYGPCGNAQINVRASSYGTAGGRDKAGRKKDANTWNAQVQDAQLRLTARSEYNQAGVNFDVCGPAVMDMDLIANHVNIDGAEGYHIATSSSLTGLRLYGSVDFKASSTIWAEVTPAPQGSIYMDGNSGVTLFLPYGPEYDLQIWGSVEEAITVSEFGFADVVLADGYFAGIVGRGTVPVTILAEDGEVRVEELR